MPTLACANFFRPSGSSSTAPMSFLDDFFGSLAPRVFPSSLSLPSEGRSRDALVLLSEGFPLLPLGLVQREGWKSLWSRVRCTQASFCLLGSFVDWGSRSCSLVADSCYLFCPGWLCTLGEVMGRESLRGFFSLFSVASPASSLHARRGGEASEASKCCSS